MTFEFWPAMAAGTIGGALMTLMRVLMRRVGIDLRLDIPHLWGTMLKAHGQPGQVIGLLIHLIGSGAIGLIYAWAFDLLGSTSHLWLWGLLGGFVHWFIAGLFMGMLPLMHVEIPSRVPPPGIFVRNFGAPDVPVFVIGHIMYGVVVSVLYAFFHSGGGIDAAL